MANYLRSRKISLNWTARQGRILSRLQTALNRNFSSISEMECSDRDARIARKKEDEKLCIPGEHGFGLSALRRARRQGPASLEGFKAAVAKRRGK